MQETPVQFLCQKDPLEKGKATQSSVLAWRIPWTVYPWGFPGGSAGEESTSNAGDADLMPELRRSPGGGNGYPPLLGSLESCLENPKDRGAWQTGVHEVAKSQTCFLPNVPVEEPQPASPHLKGKLKTRKPSVSLVCSRKLAQFCPPSFREQLWGREGLLPGWEGGGGWVSLCQWASVSDLAQVCWDSTWTFAKWSSACPYMEQRQWGHRDSEQATLSPWQGAGCPLIPQSWAPSAAMARSPPTQSFFFRREFGVPVMCSLHGGRICFCSCRERKSVYFNPQMWFLLMDWCSTFACPRKMSILQKSGLSGLCSQ